jgi:hypothetical protein
MIPKKIDEINEKDLQSLIENSVLERKTLEYKQILPGTTDSDKKEFLSDITSFTNASGGDVIFGITENTDHIPIDLSGIETTDPDAEIRRLEGIIRDAIQPRIPNIHTHPIRLENARFAIIIRIPKSWLNPHMVTFKGSSRFFTRSSNGKYQMDIGEIRSAFTLSESRIQKIKEFVQSRISEIYSDTTPIPMTNFPKLAIHIIPFSSTDIEMVKDFERIQMISVIPMFTGGSNPAFNVDGRISIGPDSDGLSRGYVQIYRNGIIEAVSSFLTKGDIDGTLPVFPLETTIIGALKNYTNILRLLGIEPPAFVFITLINVKGLIHPKTKGFFGIVNIPIQKDIISLPNFELNIFGLMNREVELNQLLTALKPSFDTLSNSVGAPRSFSYNAKGEWDR